MLGDINISDSQNAGSGQLQKKLGFIFALAVGVGAVIGAGIMRTTGPVVDQVPFMGIVLGLWVLGGLHVLLAANVASELITCVPKAGGVFVPVRLAFGESMGLLSGWTYWLSLVAACAALSIVCANFLAIIFPSLAAYTVVTATCFVLAVFGLNWIGVREGGTAQTIGSCAKMIFLCIVIGIAFFVDPVQPVALTGLFAEANPPAPQVAVPLSFLSIILAYQLIYGAYAGWETSINFVEEDEKALANLPRAIGLSILTITVVYFILNASLFKALEIQAIRTSDLPAALVLEQLFGSTGVVIVAALAILLAITALNASVMVTPRVLFGMARDGLFFSAALRVNKGGTPDFGLGVTAIFVILLIFSGGFEFVFRLMGALIIFGFVLYEASLFVLRKKLPDLDRPFKAIGYPYLPGFVLLLDTGLLIAFIVADPVSGMYMAGLTAVCIPIGIWLHNRRKQMAAI